MCAMALVHSRISRLYFIEPNTFDGAITSKLKIADYESLNHSYLSFKINI
jgi:tRNA(Arg) A34 adenosine deaminase TadA